MENIAVCEDSLLESYLETGEIEEETVRILVRERKLFPCCFGSALKMQGVEEFLGFLIHTGDTAVSGEIRGEGL